MKKMNFSRTTSLIVSCVVALGSIGAMSFAHADLIVENELPPPPIVVAYVQTLEMTGVPTSISVVRRDIRNVEFTKALKLVVPRGWRGFVEESAGLSKVGKVSAKAAKMPWTNVLENLLDQHGFRAEVNWDRKEITFKSRS